MAHGTLETIHAVAASAAPRIWALFLLFILVEPLTQRRTRPTILTMYSRPRHPLPVLWIAPATAIAYSLLSAGVPPLRFSWISALASGSGGASSTTGLNILIAPVTLPVVGPLLLLLLIVNMPLLTSLKERIFRQGTRSYLHALPRRLLFGLFHCLVGMPLAAGLSLAVPMWFSH